MENFWIETVKAIIGTITLFILVRSCCRIVSENKRKEELIRRLIEDVKKDKEGESNE